MGSPGPTPTVTPDDALLVFERVDRPGTPLTASEVAEELQCTRRTAHRKLQALAEQGDLETKKPGAHSRVWWRPVRSRSPDDGGDVEHQLERYRAIVETVDDGMYIVDEEGRFSMVNDAYVEMTGYDRDELLGEPVTKVVDVETAERAQQREQRLIEDGTASRLEAELLTADGDRLPAEATFGMLPGEDDDRKRVGAVRDVSDRVERERELEQSRQRYETLIDNFPNGAVALVGPDMRYQIVGGEPIDEKSDSPTDLEGEPVAAALTPDLASAIEPRYRDALNGEASTFTFDSGETVAWIRILPVRDEDGEVFAAMGMSQDVTEHVQRERELEDAKSRLEAATEAGAVGTWEWNIPQDRFVANPSFAGTFGVDPDAASEGVSIDRFTSAIHEDDRERVNRKIQRAVDECGEYEAEYRVWNVDGELRWVVARGHVECDEDGNPVTFPGALTDVTERKEYQRRIEESERRYRTLIENFPDGAVGLFDEELCYTAAGGEYLDQRGISPDSRIGESVYDLYPDHIVDEVEPYFEAALDGEQHSFEVEHDGLNLFAHTLPVTDAEDEVIAGMLVVQDVTERRKAQRELRESEAKFRMLAENLEEIVWMATPDVSEWIYLNPAFEDVWGIDRERLYDEPMAFLEQIHPDDRPRIEERFESLPEEDFHEVFRIVTDDEDVRWVRARGSEVHAEDEELVRLVGTGQDVTEQVEREQRLESLVDKLEESNERLERFAYVTSHDLQEPLRMVSNYLLLLERRYREELDEDAREFIDFAVDGADRMREMIDDLLAYSRLDTEAGSFETTDVNCLLDTVLTDLQFRIDETDADVSVGDLPTVDADPQQLEMVFQNLVSNAIKYSDDPPDVTIEAERQDDEWLFSVADDGIGIDPEYCDDVFDIFNRLHTTDEYPGTGIGLAMCRKIVRRHGGEIWVESCPGDGSTFHFTIPVEVRSDNAVTHDGLSLGGIEEV